MADKKCPVCPERCDHQFDLFIMGSGTRRKQRNRSRKRSLDGRDDVKKIKII